MKKYVLLLLLLIPFGVYADIDTLEGETITSSATIEGVSTTDTIEGQVITGGGACAATECSGCDGQERFECGSTAGNNDSNQENTVTYATGGANVNDAYVADPLEGSESLFYDTSDEAVIAVAGTDGDLYVSFIWKGIASPTTIVNILRMQEDDTTEVVRLTMATGGGVYNSSTVTYSGGNNFEGDDFAGATKYYWKIRFNNGSGANGIIQVWWSTTGANGEWTLLHDISDSATTEQVELLSFEADVDDLIIDDIRWDTADIDY